MSLEAYTEDGKGFIDNTKVWTSLRNGCFIGVLALAYLFGIIRFINRLEYKLWQAKGLLNIIPTKLLLTSTNIKAKLIVD